MADGASLEELAALIGAELCGDGSPTVTGVAAPSRAGPQDVALLVDPRYIPDALRSQAGAFVVTRPHAEISAPQLICSDPARALGLLLERLAAPAAASPRSGVDPRAAVDPSAKVHPAAWVGPFAFVGPEAVVGEGSRVEPFSYVGARTSVGRQAWLGPGSVLLEGGRLGDDAVLGPGAVVGFRGFGFWRDGQGWHPIPSPGGAHVAEGVEIGANSCVDAGTLGPTEVAAGVKIDNLAQVGHNCRVGPRSLLCGQVGLAGSVTVGPDCQLGGQVGVADHLSLGEGSRVAAKSGVAQDVPAGATVAGYPAIPHRRWLRASAIFARLGELARQIRELARTRDS